MKEKYLYKSLKTLVLTGMLLGGVWFLSACAGGNAAGGGAGTNQSGEALTRVLTPQEVVYNGKPQSISYQYTGSVPLDIVYYSSIRDRTDDRRGSRTAPVNAGTYYVRVRRPGTSAFPARDFPVELRILKLPVKIEAARTQEDFYNGNQKRIQAEANPPVTLSYSYYPTLELRNLAMRAATEGPQGNSSRTLAEESRRYNRVDRAPTEQGTYYVWIYFPGDDNHEAASASVDFTINPPQPRGR